MLFDFPRLVCHRRAFAGPAHRRSWIVALFLGLCLASTLGCKKNLSGTYKADLIEVQGNMKQQMPSIITVARKEGGQHTVTISGDSFIAKSGCVVETDQVGDRLYKENRLGFSQCNSTELRLYLDVTEISFETINGKTEFRLLGYMYTNPGHTFEPLRYRLVTKEFDVEN